MQNKIAILLSTYNGENYLVEQIESILSQTYSDWTLYIRDDGSQDKTVDILLDYQHKFSNIIVFQNNQTNLGPLGSYVWLMKNVESEYYMFCDQDDVWLSNKIELTFSEILKLQKASKDDLPLLVFTDLLVTDDKLNVISESMWNFWGLDKIMIPEKYLLVTTLATGCTMLFNHQAKMVSLKFVTKAIMHDSLIALSVLSSKGKIMPLKKTLINYRQHNNNVLGAMNVNNCFFSRVLKLKKIYSNNYEYFKFVNSIIKVSPFKFLLLKIEMLLRIKKVIS